jgi:hypothetical protein
VSQVEEVQRKPILSRIGVAKRIHVLTEFKAFDWGAWGVSRCGWAGLAEQASDGARVTCKTCLKPGE